MTDRGADVVVVAAARTPFAKFRGALASVSATQLGGAAVRGALERGGVDPETVDAVLLGQVLQAGSGQNPARQAARHAGIGWRAHATTVNKVCLSGLTTVIDAARMIRAGEVEVAVAGGMESMTGAPYLLPGARAGLAFGAAALLDHAAHDGLTDAFDGVAMGELTERSNARSGVSRHRQDLVALRSHQRAARASEDGLLDREIVPVNDPRSGAAVVQDQGVRPDTELARLSGLPPAFARDGGITAGNASSISDGAAAVVLTTRARAERERWAVLATVRAHAHVAGPDTTLDLQPARAVRRALATQGWAVEDLTVLELNEAFAVVVAASAGELGLDDEDPRLNPDGGAIALGHPLGASGARLVVHAAHTLSRTGGRAAVALCGGGGQGEALLLEA